MRLGDELIVFKYFQINKYHQLINIDSHHKNSLYLFNRVYNLNFKFQTILFLGTPSLSFEEISIYNRNIFFPSFADLLLIILRLALLTWIQLLLQLFVERFDVIAKRLHVINVGTAKQFLQSILVLLNRSFIANNFPCDFFL